MAMHNLIWGLATPVAGMLADRYGSARVLVAGAVIYCIGIITMAFTTTPLMFNIGGGLLVGVALGVFAAIVHLPIREQRDLRFAAA